MRSVVAFALIALSAVSAAPAAAEPLALDAGLLVDVADTLRRHHATAPLPVLDVLSAQSKGGSAGGGAGGGGGARNLPPQLSGVGLGLQIGSPTAVTLKFAGVQQNGFVVGVGAAFSGRTFTGAALSLHGDYLMHLVTLVRTDQIAMTAYAGVGLWLGLFGSGGVYGLGNGVVYAPALAFFGLGVRVPLGLSMSFSAAPIELYLELDPAVFLFPGVDFGVGASLGFRYHF